MRSGTRPKTTAGSRLPQRSVAATIVIAMLVAACGGSSGTSTAAKKASTTDTAASTDGSPHGGIQIHQSGLNFAKCMRANDVPNFPDPGPGGNIQVSAGLNRATPAFTAAQAKCQKFMPGDGPLSAGPPPSANTMALLRRVAVCMREHGVPQFPDPMSSAPSGVRLGGEYRGVTISGITNYMGAIVLFPATIDIRSPAYNHAAAACGSLAESFTHPHH